MRLMGAKTPSSWWNYTIEAKKLRLAMKVPCLCPLCLWAIVLAPGADPTLISLSILSPKLIWLL